MTGVTVFCVRLGSREPGPVMTEAFEALNEMGEDLRCEWLAEEECFKLEKREKHNVYVFEEFGCEAFEHVVSTNNKAYGPMCILTCLKKSEPLPTAHPIFCLAMKGLVVSCTSVLKEQRESVHRDIEWMSGEVSRDFHDHVTHLVAGEVCSKKYRVAADLGRPIMSVDWVEAMLKASETKLISANDPQYLKQYRCLVFKGLVITVSGLGGQERLQIKELVESEGGKYSGEMKMDECTHLVINQPQGNKYEFAKKWQLKIVRPAWVTDSIDKGYCLEEHKYKVGDSGEKGEGRQAVTSTPNRRSNQTAASISQLGDVSAITVSNVEDTTLNFTAANQSLQGTTQLMKQSPALDMLEGFNIGGWKGTMFLDGCKIFLSGFTSQQLDKLKKMLNMAGAVRLNDLTENLTHVVMGQKIEEHLKRIQSLGNRPHIVSINWLVDGFNAKKCVPEELYYTLEPPENDHLASPDLGKMKRSKSKATNKDPEPKAQAPPTSAVAMDTTGMEDILSQYLPQASTMGESTLVRMADQAEEVAAADKEAAPDSGAATRKAGTTIQQPQNYEDAETQDPNDVTELQEAEEECCPFRGKSFITFGFDEDQTADLHKYIVECGGEIAPINTRRIPDYGVVPIMGFRVERTVGEVVTNAWLQICVEMESLQPVDANEIFMPLNPRDEMARPLEGVVLSISGYVGAERDVISHIAEILGAVCQDFFVRKANAKKGLVGNTHLVVNAPEGSKFEAALKWEIPAVDKGWVIGCAKQSRRLEEGDFLVGKNREEILSNSVAMTTNKPTPSQEKMPPPPAPPSVRRVTDAPSTGKNVNQSEPVNSGVGTEVREPARKASRRSRNECGDEIESEIPAKRSTRQSRGKGENSSTDTGTEEVAKQEVEAVAIEMEDHVTTADVEAGEDDIPGAMATDAKEEEMAGLEEPDMQDDDDNDPTNSSGRLPSTSLTSGTTMGTPKSGTKVPVADTETMATPSAVKTPVIQKIGTKTPASVLNARVKKLREENRVSAKVPSPKRGCEDELSGLDTPSKFLKEGVVYKPKFDLEAAYAAVDNMPTPGRRPGQKRDSVSLEDLLSENLAIAIKNASVKQQNPGQSSVRPASPVCQSPAVLRECTPRPLGGVVIAVAKKLITRQSDYNSIAASLGADYRWTYDKSCTHFIFEGKQNDINKEFRLAKEHKKTIVSPHWLLMCQEQNCRVDESLFPHTYNPSMSLSLSSTPAHSTRATRTRSRLTRNQPTADDTVSTTKTRNQSSGLKPTVKNNTTTVSRSTRQSLRQRKSSEKESSEGDTSKENIEHSPGQEVRKTGEEDPDRTQSDEEISRISAEAELEENQAKSAGLVNDLRNLMAATTKTYGKQARRKHRRSEASFEQVLQEENGASGAKKSRPNSRNVSRAEDEENKSRNNSRCSSRNSNLLPETQASQMMEVIWDDPKAREQQEKLASDLAKYNQSVSPTTTSDGNHDNKTGSRNQGRTSSALDQLDIDLPNPQRASVEEQEETRIPTPEPPPLAFPLVKTSRPSSPPKPVDMISSEEDAAEEYTEGRSSPAASPPVFLMSGMPVQERNDYGALIEELGGKVVDAQNFDIRATHLAVEKPTRNEKFLASVAAGKWVVHKSYFEACRKEKRFVQADCYEWGTEYTASLCSGTTQHRLATAAHRWRLRLQGKKPSHQSGNSGAFSGWRVVLLTKKEDSFVRLLEAGGAEVVATRAPFSRLEDVTHAFLDLSKVKCDPDTLEALVNAGVECCKPEFIASYLTDDPLPEPKDFYVQGLGQNHAEARKRKPSTEEAPGTPGNKRRK